MNRYLAARKSRLLLRSTLALILFALAFLVTACEPGGFPVIQNQTGQSISIRIAIVEQDGSLNPWVDYGVVPAETTKTLAGVSFPMKWWVRRIEALDPSGDVIFSHDYDLCDFERIDWKIVIPP